MDVSNYLTRLQHTIAANGQSFDSKSRELAELIISTWKNSGSIYICGNGGSASSCEHFVIDLLNIRSQSFTQRIRVEALTANSAVLTAISNDINFNNVFATQITKKAQSGDLLYMILHQETPPNIILAAETAMKMGIQFFSVIGFDGGKLLELSSQSFLCKTVEGEYGVVEDVHLAFLHCTSESIKLMTKGVEFV